MSESAPAVDREFLDALLRGDRPTCARRLAARRSAGDSLEAVYQTLFQPALYEVGELWAQNRISVAVEHLATAVVEGLLSELYPQALQAPRRGHRGLVASLEGELHHVGARMVCDVMEFHGWDCDYTGPDLPTRGLLEILEARGPELLVLSVVLEERLPVLRRTLAAVRRHAPGLRVLVGGRALRDRGDRVARELPDAEYVPSLDALGRLLDAYPAPGHG